MKIIFSTDQTYLHGGIEKVMATKANYMVREWGYEVYILTTEQNKKEACYDLDKRIVQIDLAINYQRHLSYFHPKNIVRAFKHWRVLSKTIKELQPDVVIVCNYAFDFYFMPLLCKKAISIKEYHGSGYKYHENLKIKLFKRIGNWFKNSVNSKYDYIMLLNPDEKRYYKGRNIRVLPNPIVLSKKKAKLESKKVIAAGRIAPIKGFDRLITIWSEVVKEFYDWELHVYGEDYLGTEAALKTQIEKLKLRNNIFLKDTVPDLEATMMDYSLYLMTSHIECLPMVILESQSIGLPVIAFDVPHGPRNIIRHDVDGLLVENNDLPAFVNAVKSLIADKDKRLHMGLEAKRNAEKFAIDEVMQEWAGLILPHLKGRS